MKWVMVVLLCLAACGGKGGECLSGPRKGGSGGASGNVGLDAGVGINTGVGLSWPGTTTTTGAGEAPIEE